MGLSDFEKEDDEGTEQKWFRGLELETLRDVQEKDDPELTGPGAYGQEPEHFIEFAEEYGGFTFGGVATGDEDRVTRVHISSIEYEGLVSEKILLGFIKRFGEADEVSAEVVGYNSTKDHHIAKLRAWYD